TGDGLLHGERGHRRPVLERACVLPRRLASDAGLLAGLRLDPCTQRGLRGGQEPGSEKEIGEFCRATYGVTFPMMSKVGTKPGSGQSDIYAFLGAATGKLPSWNFGKYLVGRDGVPVAFYGSGVKPMGDELRTAIDAALAKPAPGGAPPAGAAADAPAAPKAP
ncbi:MAG: hypothetical protein ACKOTD_04655, partial [Phycisphaerales bacterium]